MRCAAVPLALVLVGGCGRPAEAPVQARGVPVAAAPADPRLAEVVATVDGRPIRVADVEAQARAAGGTAREALEALIDAEATASEAGRRGLRGDPEVQDAERRELARRYLQLGFERDVTPAMVTEADLRHAYEQNKWRLVHPEMRRTLHILATVAPGDDAARRALALKRAEAVAARARSVHSAAEFEALADAIGDPTFPLRAERFTTGRAGPAVEPFAAAAFALARPGAVSGVVETQYGYHVIFLEGIVPPENVSYEQAVPRLRDGLWPGVQRRELARLIDSLRAEHQVVEQPEKLDVPAP